MMKQVMKTVAARVQPRYRYYRGLTTTTTTITRPQISLGRMVHATGGEPHTWDTSSVVAAAALATGTAVLWATTQDDRTVHCAATIYDISEIGT